MKEFFKNRENNIVTALFLLTIIVAISPLISRYCINGHDIDYHLLRIEALKEDILIGRPFLKVNTLFFGGAGYASSLFYSNFLLYIPASLRALGVSIGVSYHIFAALCVILCFLSTYYCVSHMTESRYAGLVAGILITLCPYHMDDVMVRAATGEYMAFIFVPFVLYGIYNVLYEEMNKPWLLGVGFAGVLLSHTATFVMCAIFGIAAFLIKIKTFIKSPKLIVKLIVTAVIAALATSFLWLPMLEQFLSTSFRVSTGEQIDMLDAAVDFSQVLSQQFPTVGIMLILLAIPRVFISKKDDKLIDYADWMLIGGVVFAVAGTNLLPWNYLSRVLSFVQFPWRFFLISSLLLTMADAIILMKFVNKIINDSKAFEKKEAFWEVIIIVVFVAMAGLALTHQADNALGYYDYSEDYYSYKPHTTNVIGGEWLPERVTDVESILELSEVMTSDSGENIEFERIKGKVIANISSDMEYVDVPLIYYKGYSATVVDDSGKATKLSVNGDGINGMCRVLNSGITGQLVVNYTGTVLQKISYVLSIITVAGYLFVIIRSRKSKQENK